jgi:hypothetical protein
VSSRSREPHSSRQAEPHAERIRLVPQKTIACALACLARRRLELLALGAGGNGVVAFAPPIPYAALGNEDLLRPLGAVFVVIATLWFCALAASRVERPAPDLTR